MTVRQAIRWLAIIVNLVWGSLSLFVALDATLSGESVTESEQRVAYIGGFIALFAVLALFMSSSRGVVK
jgi:hypothetical protein